MSSIKKISGVVLAGAVLVLAGCGGDDSGTTGGLGGTTGGGTTGTGTGGTTGSTASTAHTIVLSYPMTNSIEDLKGGFYRRIGKAIVTDREGNAVPDGTVVYFNVIDSVIATGSITTAAGDSITGSVLTDSAPQLADGTATNFVDAKVSRNSAYRFIDGSDHVFLLDAADAADKNRMISTDTGSIASTALTMTSAYSSTYPSSIYPTGTTSYVVGASLLGAEVSGLDADGTTLHTGYAVTKGGLATFYVTYPASKDTILTGCSISSIDTRALPVGSADVYLVASAANNVTTIDNRFCFSSIAGWTITPDYSSISGTRTISLQVVDGGDKVPLPFVGVTADVAITTNTGGLNVTLSGGGSYITSTNGYVSSTITVTGGASGDAATVTYRSGDATTVVDVAIP